MKNIIINVDVETDEEAYNLVKDVISNKKIISFEIKEEEEEGLLPPCRICKKGS